jgi:predicted outer membrane protein
MDRRSVLAGIAVIGSIPAFAQSQAPSGLVMPVAMSTTLAEVKTAAQYYAGVIGRAELSLASSAMAVEMAANKNAHEFAGFELGEAITVNMVLKDMGTMAPKMDASGTAMLTKMKAASKGNAFDREYIAFQLTNHEQLRDLADAYLHNTAGTSDAAEKHGRHMAMLMLAVFKEHVAITKRISGELGA